MKRCDEIHVCFCDTVVIKGDVGYFCDYVIMRKDAERHLCYLVTKKLFQQIFNKYFLRKLICIGSLVTTWFRKGALTFYFLYFLWRRNVEESRRYEFSNGQVDRK
jgi:hypothetical protein